MMKCNDLPPMSKYSHVRKFLSSASFADTQFKSLGAAQYASAQALGRTMKRELLSNLKSRMRGVARGWGAYTVCLNQSGKMIHICFCAFYCPSFHFVQKNVKGFNRFRPD